MNTVLVAGGAGFIGSHLCEVLLDRDNKVICVDNLITSSKDNISSFINNPKFVFIDFDITKDLSTISHQLSGVSFIYHLASPASPNKKSLRSYVNFPIETMLVNSIGTYNLLDLTKEKNAKFLFASTSEVYGNPKESPQKETYFGNVNPIGVRSVYDESKRFGEAITMAYIRKYNIDARIIRIFNTYGDRMQKDDGRVISNFITQALDNQNLTVYGDGSQTRSFCYINDMIEGIIKAMELDETKGEVINLGNPKEDSIIEIARLIKELTRTTSEIEFEDLPEDDPERRKPDIEKARKILGFEPRVSLNEGLIKTIEYFKLKKNS